MTAVLVAGASGDLGQRIVCELLTADPETFVRVLTRSGGGRAKAMFGEGERVEVREAAYSDHAARVDALSGSDAVVSAVALVGASVVDRVIAAALLRNQDCPRGYFSSVRAAAR